MKSTLTKSKAFLVNLSKALGGFILVGGTSAWAANGEMPIDDKKITMPDGRDLIAKRAGDHSHYLILKKGEKVLWKKRFEFEYDRLWDYAFFVPVVIGKHVYDIDKNGIPEIAVATWDGGNNIINRTALVFSVRGNKLEYFETKKFNLEYGEAAYPDGKR